MRCIIHPSIHSASFVQKTHGECSTHQRHARSFQPCVLRGRLACSTLTICSCLPLKSSTHLLQGYNTSIRSSLVYAGLLDGVSRAYVFISTRKHKSLGNVCISPQSLLGPRLGILVVSHRLLGIVDLRPPYTPPHTSQLGPLLLLFRQHLRVLRVVRAGIIIPVCKDYCNTPSVIMCAVKSLMVFPAQVGRTILR